MWKVLTFAFLIVGSIIGAGFASGKEILVFFGNFTVLTPLSLVILFVTLFFALYVFAMIGKAIKPKTIQDVNGAILNKGNVSMNIAIVVCLVLLLGAMLAGCDALGHQLLNDYSFPFIGMVSGFLAVVIISFGFNTFKIVNNILVVILIILVNLIAIKSLINPLNENIAFETLNIINSTKAIFFPVLYVSLNMITESILSAVGAASLTKKQIVAGICVACSVLVCSVFIALFALIKNYSVAINSSLPMLALAQLLGGAWPIIYGIILWTAIFTTILSCLFCAGEWLNKHFKNKFLSALTLIAVAYAFSLVGFDSIVEYFYPLYGIVGAVFIFLASKFFFKNIYKKHKFDKSF